jgi:hypothetical protein
MDHGSQFQVDTMQNIKNFTLTEPTQMQLQAFENDAGDVPLFLISDDGQDWYECQSLFADDTIKIMYDSSGIIRSVVDQPVPQRGNIHAVSMFFPEGFSVSEVESLPAGFEITSGTWVYDGTQVYQDTELATEKALILNRLAMYRRMSRAAAFISTLQSCAVVGEVQDGDDALILELQQYLAALRSVDLLQLTPAWPTPPATLP